jgi:hypothetical protein
VTTLPSEAMREAKRSNSTPPIVVFLAIAVSYQFRYRR